MKFTWEKGDLTNGRIVVRNGVRYVIGYVVGSPKTRDVTKRCLIDLRDGAVLREHTLDDLAAHLTKGDYAPESFSLAKATPEQS